LVTGVCLYTDLTRRKIYNYILVPAVLTAASYHISSGGLAGGWYCLQGLALGTALLFVPYAAGGIGAGDVKLLGTIGSLKGPAFVFKAFLAGATAGGIIAAYCLVKNKKLLLTLKRLFSYSAGTFRSDLAGSPMQNNSNEYIPYGVAIAIGVLAAYYVR